MNRSAMRGRVVATAIAASCLLAMSALVAASVDSVAADGGLDNFDHQSGKVYRAYDATPESYMAAPSGDRTLADYYSRRQYPGSPPVIPHPVDLTFSGQETDCLSCHAKGGFSPEFAKFAPVTPHPENVLCYQCHAQQVTEEPLVDSNWQSIDPPRLGKSVLAGSPPTIPHSLQLRENCIACHTGPGAVVEIRVAHVDRGNCRQCHVVAPQTAPMAEFHRN